jgi:hypothetical protein
MTELSRLVRRYKAATYLREKMRDRFNDEAAFMRLRMRQLCNELGDIAIRTTPEGRIAREFDENAQQAVNSARAVRFDDALEFIVVADLRLQTMEAIVSAWKTIQQLGRDLAELKTGLEGLPDGSFSDFRILLSRAQTFYDQAKYQTAFFIASEALHDLASLSLAVENATLPLDLTSRMAALEGMAITLQTWGIAADDSTQIRRALQTMRRTLAAKRYGLLRLLVAEVETDKSQIRTFIDLLHLLQKASPPAQQFVSNIENGGHLDWFEATNRLLAYSLAQTSNWLNEQPSALSQATLAPDSNDTLTKESHNHGEQRHPTHENRGAGTGRRSPPGGLLPRAS